MKYRILYIALIVLNILVIAFFIVQYASATYPMVGSDYRLFGPRLIDSFCITKLTGSASNGIPPVLEEACHLIPILSRCNFRFNNYLPFSLIHGLQFWHPV